MLEKRLRKKYNHKCEIKANINNSLMRDFQSRNIFKYMTFLSETNPRIDRFCTQYKICEERKRQAKTRLPCLIHPLSKFRTFWEYFMILVNLAILFVQPISSAFVLFPKQSNFAIWQDYTRNTFDIICCVDIFINLNTAFYNKENEICFNWRKIVRKYLATYFVFDFLSCLPQLYATRNVEFAKLSNTLYTLNSIITLMKLLRLISLIVYTNHILQMMEVAEYNVLLILILLCTLIILHWVACVAILEAVLSSELYNHSEPVVQSWLIYYDVFKGPLSWIYLMALYKTLCITAHSEMYNPITNFSVLDQIYSSLMWLLLQLIIVFIICSLLYTQRAISHARLKSEEMKYQLLNYMKHKDFLPETQKSLYLYFTWQFRNGFYDKNEFHQTIPYKYYGEIVSTNYENLRILGSTDIFRGFYDVQLLKLTTYLKRERYLAKQIVFKAGSLGTSLYFVVTGWIVLYTEAGIKLYCLYDGDYFGEIEFAFPEEPRCITAIAEEYTEVYRISRSALLEANPHAAEVENIKQIAIKTKGLVKNINIKLARDHAFRARSNSV